MPVNLTGKTVIVTVIVTGGDRDIDLACALRSGELGARVAINFHSLFRR